MEFYLNLLQKEKSSKSESNCIIEYCKKAKKENEECIKFLSLKDKKYEDHIKKNIETNYETIVKNFLGTILIREGRQFYENWFQILFKLITKAISKLSPSFRDIKDSLDINDYIKIKILKYKDQSKCRLIDGYVLTKNVASKKMKPPLENPKILLFDCGLDFNKIVDPIQIRDFSKFNEQKPFFVENIQKKIDSLGANLILVNKNIDYELQNEFLKKNKIIFAVVNVKSKSLKRIARCTKTNVLTSIDDLNGNVILGKCKKFNVEKIKVITIKDKNMEDIIENKDYYLMTFEDNDNILFQSIVLTGPNKKDLIKLKTILTQKVLVTIRDFFLQKTLLYFLYCDIPKLINPNHFIYPKKTLNRINMNFFENRNNTPNNDFIKENENFDDLSSLSPFPQSNFQKKFDKPNKLISSHLSTLNIGFSDFLTANKGEEFFQNGFDKTNIIKGKVELFFIKIRMCIGTKKINGENQFFNFNFSDNPLNGKNNKELNDQLLKERQSNIGSIDELSFINLNNGDIIPTNTNINSEEFSENSILKMINYICGFPEELKLFAYSNNDNLDKPMGKFILDLCAEKNYKCEKCKRLKSDHFYYLYSNIGARIKITFLKNNTSECKLDKVLGYIDREGSTEFSKYNNYESKETSNVDYLIDIFCYGYCIICKEVVTPLIKLPRDIFNYSSVRFLKQLLLNHEIRNRSDEKVKFNLTEYFAKNNCNHLSFKNIERIFVTKIGVIKFSYDSYVRYYFESIQNNPIQILSNDKNFKVICEYDACEEILNQIEENFQLIKMDIANLKSLIDEKKIVNTFIDNLFDNTNSQIDKIIKELFPNIKKTIKNVFVQKFDNFSKRIVYIKKAYFRLCQIKIMYNKIRNIIYTIKHFICAELYLMQNPNKEENEKEDNLSNIINIKLIFEKYKNLFQDIPYIDIDSKKQYLTILDQLSYYDDKHMDFSSVINENDLSSIISYALSSDSYKNYINGNFNKSNLLDIKCERNRKFEKINNNSNFISLLSIGPSIISNEKNTEQQIENKMYTGLNENMNLCNIETIPKEELFDTLLLFEPIRNNYITPDNKENNKINIQLETELLNDEQGIFTFQMKNINSSTFYYKSISRRMTISSKQTIMRTSNINIQNEKGPFETLDDQLNPKEDKILKSFEEIDDLNEDLKKLKLNKPNYQIDINQIEKINFIEDTIPNSECEVIIYYPRQFEALRIAYCCTYDELITSITNSNQWNDVSGGKSKAVFFKSANGKYLFKLVNKNEFNMFIEAACQYFHHMTRYLFHKMPSILIKMLGAYKIKIKKNDKNQIKVTSYFLFLMENLDYGISSDGKNIKKYDLKGSLVNRYIQKKNRKNKQVLLDTNFKEDFNGEPIALDKNVFKLLSTAIHNDTLMLSRINVIDYSLLINISDMIENESKYIKCGIIDYIRKYTWDKQLEHVGKVIINGLNTPTIISPNDYKERFKLAIESYFIGI